MATPVTPGEDDKVRELHAQGLSRNQIAKAVGRSGATVSAICKRLGLEFKRTEQLVEATKVAAADIAARTAVARQREQDILDYEQKRVLDVIAGRATFPARVRGTGGSERIENLTFIPAEETQKLATARASMQSTIARMAPKDTEDRDKAVSVLDQIITQLGVPDE